MTKYTSPYPIMHPSLPEPGQNGRDRLIVDRLLAQFWSYKTEMTGHRDEIVKVQSLFENKTVWPDQCEYAMATFNTARRPVKKLAGLLATKPSLPRKFRAQRYPILVETHQVDAQIDDLIAEIAIFRKICQNPSQQSSIQHQEIHYKIGAVCRNYENLLDKVDLIGTQTFNKNLENS